MNKSTKLLAAIGLLLVIAIAVIVYVVTRPDAATSAMTPNNYAKAKATPITGVCLNEPDSLKVSASERAAVEMVAMSHLIDVPAGTNVDIKIATYSENKVTGSARYPSQFGRYNFVMEQQDGNWAITAFKRCS